MKKVGVIAALGMTTTLVLAVPMVASAQSPPPGAYRVGGTGNQVWAENAKVGHGFRYPLKIKLTSNGMSTGTPMAGVKVMFFLRQWPTYGPGNPATGKPTTAGPLFKTSKGLSDRGFGISNSQGIATSPPVIAEGSPHQQWIEMAFVAPRTPAPGFTGPVWLLDVT